jgi:hypothetical protein
MMLHDHFLGFRFRAEFDRTPAQSRRPAAAARTVTLTVPASRETVFNFLADIESLPRWAAGFCERLELAAGRWTALTSFGDLWLELTADARAGTIDLHAAEDAGRMDPLFSVRLHDGPNGGTRICFTLLPRAGCDAECHERHCREFLLDLRGLLVRFGGGDLQATAPAHPSPDKLPGEQREGITAAEARGAEFQRAFDRSWTGLGGNLFERLRPLAGNRPERDLRTSVR